MVRTTPHRPRSPRRAVATTVGCVVLTSLVLPPAAAHAGAAAPPAHSSAPRAAGSGDPAAFTPATAIEPRPGVYGTFTDTYRQNVSANDTPQANPAIGVLTPMLDYFTPGSSWNDGTVLNAQLHAENIGIVEDITRNRTDAESDQAWIDDRRHQSYSLIAGLGEDAEEFASLTGAGTTITEVPADALTVRYSDEGNANGVWADADSPLGSAVRLVNTLRGPYASGNHAKFHYQYMRPFRWSSDVEVVPELVVRLVPEADAASDGGFPSGHTNAAFIAGLALASSAPEHYDELLMTAADLGRTRVVSGMHSPLDVIGGRILATGIAGATLADPENSALIAQARTDTRELLDLTPQLDADRETYQAELARYHDLTTFGLTPVGASGEPVHVPAGAESLLRSRFPYLSDDQLRWVLYSTAVDSSLPLVGDAEGWGRIDLYSAVHGFGTLDRDVSVTMDAAAGGTAAADVWLNDIDGAGGLTKHGTGSLTLAGENSFAGGVLVAGGDVVATLAESLGAGAVEVRAGALVDTAAETVQVADAYVQGRDATLRLTQETASAPALAVEGTARYAGTLEVDVAGLGASADGVRVIEHDRSNGRFASVAVTGGAEGIQYTVDYRKDGVYVVAVAPRGQADATPGAAPAAAGEPGLPRAVRLIA